MLFVAFIVGGKKVKVESSGLDRWLEALISYLYLVCLVVVLLLYNSGTYFGFLEDFMNHLICFFDL